LTQSPEDGSSAYNNNGKLHIFLTSVIYANTPELNCGIIVGIISAVSVTVLMIVLLSVCMGMKYYKRRKRYEWIFLRALVSLKVDLFQKYKDCRI